MPRLVAAGPFDQFGVRGLGRFETVDLAKEPDVVAEHVAVFPMVGSDVDNGRDAESEDHTPQVIRKGINRGMAANAPSADPHPFDQLAFHCEPVISTAIVSGWKRGDRAERTTKSTFTGRLLCQFEMALSLRQPC
jgi:hypothetical protein